MDSVNGHYNIQERVALYRQFDETRQRELDSLAGEFIHMKSLLSTLQGDLDDERETRRNYKKRAEDAELAISRNQFILVLVDGDGYIFKDAFLKAATESGGSQAARALRDEVIDYVTANGITNGINGDIQVMVHVYANRSGLAKTLYDAALIYSPNDLDLFFCNFSQSQSLFQFVDCGYGKERVDAKIRDTYRFFAYNAQCRHILLACTHDSGYVAELDKYRLDTIARSKTTLVHAAQSASAVRAYASLPFPVTRFNAVFQTAAVEVPVKPQRHAIHSSEVDSYMRPASSDPSSADVTPTLSRPSVSTTPGLVPAVLPVRTNKLHTPPPQVELPKPAKATDQKVLKNPIGDPKTGIPINRAGQRVDLRMKQPSTQEQERFDARISYRKLCNEHFLRDNCGAYNCKYDHDPIDEQMKATLRYKARSIPCSAGMKCRRIDCYYGHQCPWGNTNCTNPKCAFLRNGLHDITDLEVAKFVPAAQA